MNQFKQKNYFVIKKAISKEFAEFIYNYLVLKSNVVDNLFKDKYLEPFNTDLGTFGTNEQVNIPETYCCYGDFVMETLLLKLKGKMEKLTKLQLIPNYSYTRLYRRGSILPKHKDRFSCGISTTLNLGGDPWPIYIEPDSTYGNKSPEGKYIMSDSKGVKVNLAPGDMLVYNGIDCEHWREEFKGEKCGQVFLHYQENTRRGLANKFDGRPAPGFPAFYRKTNED